MTLVVPPTASALSCVPAEYVADEAAHLFTGRIVDSRANRILVEVERVTPGDDVAAQLWLKVELGVWMPWRQSDQGDQSVPMTGHGVPQHYTDPRPWVFAADKHWTVNACTAWRGVFKDPTLQPVTTGLVALPVQGIATPLSGDQVTEGAPAADLRRETTSAAAGLSTGTMVWSAVAGVLLGAIGLVAAWTISPISPLRRPRPR